MMVPSVQATTDPRSLTPQLVRGSLEASLTQTAHEFSPPVSEPEARVCLFSGGSDSVHMHDIFGVVYRSANAQISHVRRITDLLLLLHSELPGLLPALVLC